MTTGAYAVITGGTITNIVAWDGVSPLGGPLGPRLDQLSPIPQIGWAAAETAGVWSFTAPAAPAQTAAQQAAAALTAGITITSTGTPALDGQYDVGPAAQLNINSTWNYVIRFGTFFGGATSLQWADMAGALHTFPTVAAFEAFAVAVGNYVAALTQVQIGASTTLPSASATIA